MASQGIFLSLIFNISMLFTISSLLTRIPSLRYLVMERWDRLGGRLMLSLIFSAVSILSTYTGINVKGVIVNTRVIGVLAGGLIGGPVVGITVGILAGLHRLLFVGGFTTYACALSCALYGFICAAFYPHFVRGSWEGGKLFCMTLICETLHMSLILMISRPFDSAVEAVRILALPMVVLNALGTLMFLSNFTKTFREKDHESARNLKIALSIAQQCLPHLRRGLTSRQDMAQTVDIILSAGIGDEVIITNKDRVLAGAASFSHMRKKRTTVPHFPMPPDFPWKRNRSSPTRKIQAVPSSMGGQRKIQLLPPL
ncbi:LytS/YhcK type 5TM receptor domain-containing protein [Clostridium sp. AM58-1XD]|uniref:LytS/YhcK type 5TM receptor domain-containing protein n=1 Tax=Clostridium sp. AM58-1XD TaxID=2292307 RepID=UPI000E52AD98|nr:LytS/YhcK type 5TM receptor domain-containing protein [Clostridium sp. AM58-1XD]RGY97619.1 hypothetical protein DXA13_13990 [Clostridium sp. AM58-1XD]